MATSTNMALLPPEKFDFSRPDAWPRWIKRFERYRVASGLSEKSGPVQVSALVYTMGTEAEDVLTSFGLSDADAENYGIVKERYQGHFVHKRNPIYERARFNKRTQEPGETVDSFLTALYCLAEHCDYGALRDQMIRDRLVVGLLDANLAEKLQLESDLKLEDAVKRARNSEAVKGQQQTVRGSPASSTHAATAVDAIQTRQKWPSRGRSSPKTSIGTHTASKPPVSQPSTSTSRCGWCGNDRHPRDRCPAKNSRCRQCSKMGHYAAVCRSTPRAETASVNTVEGDAADAFLGTIGLSSAWTQQILLNKVPVEMKIDTGADVTAIPETVYKQELQSAPKLSQPSRILRGPDGKTLPTVGSFHTSLTTESPSDHTTQQTVFVVRGLRMSLLGRPAIQALHILKQLDSLPASGLTGSNIVDTFPSLFTGLGEVKGPPHKIRLRNDATPYSLLTPRRVPLPLVEKVSNELTRMEKQGIIQKIDEPTDWCAGMVVVPKPNGSLRICGDFTRLNESIRRERHILPSVEHLLASIQGAKFFSKMDANSGFHQIPLDEASRCLTTFITPLGRYCYCRLPFGISSAPEYFQKRMTEILDGLNGVLCMIDDVLVYGATQEEHDRRLLASLEQIQKAGITLNRAKCQFGVTCIHFCGYVIDSSGIRPNPAKVEALTHMPTCQSVADVRRFLGMANQLGRFSPSLAALSQPLRELLVKTNDWCWGIAQQQAFDRIKAELSSSPVLALYNPNYDTCVSSDASSFGLGAVIRQKQPSGEWQPVAYQSRAMTPTEQRYSQIEKEALGITWACERFSHYLLGSTFSIETDHKPLVPLLSSKPLDSLPPRVLRFRLRLLRYHFTISHVPGKDLVIADALSRAPVASSSRSDQALQADVEAFVAAATDSLPATDKRLADFRAHQVEDESCSALACFCVKGWPNKEAVPGPLKPYWAYRGNLSLDQDGLLLCAQRIVVPAALRLQREVDGFPGLGHKPTSSLSILKVQLPYSI